MLDKMGSNRSGDFQEPILLLPLVELAPALHGLEITYSMKEIKFDTI
jgi:hypothetical protein